MNILNEIIVDNFSLMLKTYQLLREGYIASNKEIEILIEFHNQNENYEISDKLLKMKNIN